MKVALVHDYLREYGGAERVVEAMHELWPEAPLYVAFVDWDALGLFADKFKDWDIRTTWVQRNWLVRKFHSPLRFLAPLVWESLDLKDYDVVISSSGWYMCRGVVTRPETLHISYIHHPPRNLYGFATGSATNGLIQAYATLINPFLRTYDFTTAQRVDYLVANSETTRERIWKYYRREAKVIYPPAQISAPNVQRLVSSKKEDYFLSVGRLNYAKRIDLGIEACNRLNLPLKIVGTGREEKSLRQIAGPTIEFLGVLPDEKMAEVYAGARAVIFCAVEEDFGLVPVEAMSCGVPVVALRQGGVVETVMEGKTGIFFEKAEVEDVISALKRFEKITFNPQNCSKRAHKFSKKTFQDKFKHFVDEKYRQKAES